MLTNKRVKIAVVMGGISREREVSLKSGENVYRALKRLGYDARPVDYRGDPTAFLREVEEVDLAFNMLHGHFGEDGGIQFLMEAHGISYTCSDPYTSAVCFDKLLTYRILDTMVEVPKYSYRERADFFDGWNLPVILKPRREGSSIGVKICKSKDEAISHASTLVEEYGGYIVQRYVRGKELTVSVLEIEGKPVVLPILELRPKREFYDYIAKYTKGMTEFVLPAELNAEDEEKVKSIALQVYNYLGCRDMARIDGIFVDGKFYFLEVNTIPGMTELSDLPASAKALGMSFEEVVDAVVKSALKRKRRGKDVSRHNYNSSQEKR